MTDEKPIQLKEETEVTGGGAGALPVTEDSVARSSPVPSKLLRPKRDYIPAELRERPQWVVWRMELKTGTDGESKLTKVPYTLGGVMAKSNDPRTWMSFDKAWALYGAGYDGVGYMFSADDPYAGIDLDAAVPQAEKDEIVAALDSYTERSPSGRGLHIIVRATAPHRKKDGREVHSSGQYFTMTGARVVGPSPNIEERQAAVDILCKKLYAGPVTATRTTKQSLSDHGIIDQIFAGPRGDALRKAWEANESEGDWALASRIADRTGNDPEWIEQIMRTSPFVRPKYDEARGDESYLRHTINRVLEGRPQFAGKIEFVVGETVKIRNVDWLWESRLPLGGLTLLSGQPGLGKSTLTFWIAAEVTRGTLPGALHGTPHNVIIASAEDQLEAVIAPRLKAAGADMSRVIIAHHGKEDLLETLAELRNKIQETDARLVSLDPMNAFIPSGINTWKDAEVRRVLAPLAALADESNCGVLLVSHLNKGSKGNDVDVYGRVGGSIGFTGAARSLFVVVPDPADPEGDERIFGHFKANMGILQPARRFRVVSTAVIQPNDSDGHFRETIVYTSKVVWGDEVKMSHEEMLSKTTSEERQVKADCEAWIREVLAAGPMPSKQFEELGLAKGFSKRTIERSRRELKVRSVQGSGGWTVSLPLEFPSLADLDAKGVGKVAAGP